MKKTITAILLFCALGLSARAQTLYVPTCLTPAQVATVTQSTAALAPILLFDETDAALRLADAQCNNVKVATGLLADVAQAKADIAALKAVVPVAGPQGIPGIKGDKGDPGPQGIPGPPGAGTSIGARKSASGYTIRIPAISLIGASAPANFQQPTACGLASKLILDAAGNYYDFLVNVPQAGNYLLAENVAFDVVGIPFVNHFESPPGTKVGGTITVSSTNGWSTSPNSAPVPLQPGFQLVRLVVDTTVPNSANALCWIQATQQ